MKREQTLRKGLKHGQKEKRRNENTAAMKSAQMRENMKKENKGVENTKREYMKSEDAMRKNMKSTEMKNLKHEEKA